MRLRFWSYYKVTRLQDRTLDKPPKGYEFHKTTVGERVYRKRLPWRVVARRMRLLLTPSFRKNKAGALDQFRVLKSLAAQPTHSTVGRPHWPPWTTDTASSPY